MRWLRQYLHFCACAHADISCSRRFSNRSPPPSEQHTHQYLYCCTSKARASILSTCAHTDTSCSRRPTNRSPLPSAYTPATATQAQRRLARRSAGVSFCTFVLVNRFVLRKQVNPPGASGVSRHCRRVSSKLGTKLLAYRQGLGWRVR